MTSKNAELLGEVISNHPVGSYGPAYVIIGLLFVLFSIFVATFGLGNNPEYDVTPLLLLSFICITIGLVILYRWNKYRNSFVAIYKDGFVCFISGKKFSFRWHEIDYVLQRTDNARIQGIMTPEKTYLFVKMINGEKFKFTQNIYQDIGELAVNFQSNMAKQRLLEDTIKLENGEVVSYGVFKLDKEGIMRSFRKIRWSEINDVEQTNRRVKVSRKGSRIPWSRPFNFQIHNIYVFISMANRLLELAAKITNKENNNL